MMKKYIDLHAHPFKEYFENPEEVVETSFEKGVGKIFLVGTSIEDCQEVKELASKYSYTFPIIGIHPNNAFNEQDLQELTKMMDDSIVGIGEVGLDFHYDDSPSFAEQKKFFEFQIELANKWKIPIIVHTRDAILETFNILKEYKEKNPDMKIIIHSYSCGSQWVKKFLEIDAYLSYSGIVTFKNAEDFREAIKITPINRLFYETDTPYLSPAPLRGKTNLPHHVIHTANLIAKLKNISIDELNEQVNQNVELVFKIKKDQHE